MIDKNTKNCSLTKRIISLITSMMIIVIAQILAEKFLGDSFLWTLLVLIILAVLFQPVGLWIDQKINTYFEHKSES